MQPEIFSDIRQFQIRLANIQEEGNLCVDLHVHSSQSDGLHSIQRLANYCEERGIIIAVTDHNLVVDLSDLPRSQNKFIIPAIELTSCEAVDILCYFYDWETLNRYYDTIIQPNKTKPYALSLSAEKILCTLREYRCVVTIPHPSYPYDKIRSNFIQLHTENRLSQEALQAIHSIEVFNCSRDKELPEEINDLAALLNKNMVTGSDAHTVRAAGNSITYCEAKNRAEFLDKLAAGDVRSIAIPSHFTETSLPKVKMAWLHLKGLPFIR